ncbi:MAG: Gfo/Idh/MocA family oxidoreductase [Clostridiales bacterium]|jgi:predicted dehydrogenase|nr:Gfo/Idh/MocA family oxidoreductase [Clostridiales bacterium]
MNERIKMAIVGAGTWGEIHGELYNSSPFSQCVAICDTNEARAAAVAERLGIPQVYGSHLEMLERCQCDAVAVVTPDFLHAKIGVDCVNAKKHLLLEKPLATSQADTERLIQAIEANGVRAMVDFHNRWSPPFQETRRAVAAGELGRLVSGYFRLNDTKWVATDLLPWAAQSSILWFLGSHSLDALRWLFNDEASRVYSVSTSGILKGLGVDTADQYLTTIEFRNGCVAQMENGWITPNANPCVNDIKCTLLGDKGMIAIDASHHNLIQKYTDQSVKVPDVLVSNRVYGQPKGFAYDSILGFARCLYTGEEFPLTIYDAANTTLTLLAIMRSAETRLPVDVAGLYGQA